MFPLQLNKAVKKPNRRKTAGKIRRPSLRLVIEELEARAVPSISASGMPITGTEGNSFNGIVATFTDSDVGATVNNFTTSIAWGDGITSAGTVQATANGFQVTGSHTYADESSPVVIGVPRGPLNTNVSIVDTDGSIATASSTASIADAPLTAVAIPVTTVQGVTFSGLLATLTDANPGATEYDFYYSDTPTLVSFLHVTIDWGDGTIDVQGNSFLNQAAGIGTPFEISGKHTYANAGSYTIKLTITDEGGSTATTSATATVTPLSDIAGRVSENGQWWVGQSNGSSFTNSLWGDWNPAVTWVDVVKGDFNGDGLTDIAGRDLSTGNWWVGLSNGSGFTTSLWTTWNPNATWVDVQVGDFTGDGKADIVGRVLQTGQWWVAQSTGSSFTNSLWTTWNPMATWVDVKVGDFNGDGKADITGRYLQGGSWWTGVSTGSSFTTSMWTVWSTAVTWVDVQVGDFNGDGFADIAGRASETGQWWVGFSNGSKGGPPVIHPVPATGFENVFWTSWSTTVTWVDVKVGDFNGDGSTDIIGRTRETGQWWVSLSPFMPCLESCVMNTNPQTLLFATWSTAVTWVDVQVGDFNGDGKSDITGRALQTGGWWTGISNGSTFTTSLWATWSTAVNWVDVRAGDFA